jgi:hypothetical protein
VQKQGTPFFDEMRAGNPVFIASARGLDAKTNPY